MATAKDRNIFFLLGAGVDRFFSFHVQREELTDVILRLLEAWGDPLSQFHRSMSQEPNQDFNHYSSNKALEISDMVHELKDGVAKMAEKVRVHLQIVFIAS